MKIELRPGEQVRFAGRFLTLTTERKEDRTLERAYSRNGVTVLVESAPGVLRFPVGIRWDSDKQIPTPFVVSGYVEDDEEPLKCAERELREELGVEASEWTHYLTSEWKGTVIKRQEYYLARVITQGVARPDADENISGYIDLTFAEVRKAVCNLEFGTNENAFALLKYISE